MRVDGVAGARTYVVECACDLADRLVQKTYPSGRIVDYARNTRGQVIEVTTKASAMGTPVVVATALTYEPFGPVNALTHGNGVTVALAYDLDGRLSAMDAYDGGTPVLDLDYTYDLAGNITDIDDTGGGSRGRNYAYDPLHRLTQGQELAPGGSPVTLQTDFTYDSVGNRTTRNVGGAAETYTNDVASNRLLSVLAGGVTRSFTYSATGNVTVDDLGGAATNLTYNAADRLVQVSAGGVTLVDYVYAATGQRAIKATPLATTHYLYDPGGALYAETDGAGTVLREYITLGGATIAIVDAMGMSFVHSDHLAAPQVMTDGAAAVVWDASYRPFGEVAIAGAAANEQRFPGQTADAETGYSDNWHRTYDPSLGRYLQSDPIGLMAGLNTYGYAGGNPVMNADPTGQLFWFGPLVWTVVQVVVIQWTVYEILNIAVRVTERYGNGCRGWDLITRWEMFEIVTAGRVKYVKLLYRAGRGGLGRFAGRNSGGGGVPTPTRGGGTGGPGGGGGSGGGSGGGGGSGAGGSGGKGPGGPGGPDGTGDEGGLNLFKWGDDTSTNGGGWKSGDWFLHLPNQGSAKANWKQNSGRLREEIGKGEPIYDSYIDPTTGQQIPTGGFLNAERNLLESRGWIYNPFTGAYHPPGG